MFTPQNCLTWISPACSDPHQMKKYPGPCAYKYSRELKNPPISSLWPVIIFLCILFLLTNSWNGHSNNQLKLSKYGKMKQQQPYRTVLRCTNWMCRCSEMLPLRITTSVLRNIHLQWHHISKMCWWHGDHSRVGRNNQFLDASQRRHGRFWIDLQKSKNDFLNSNWQCNVDGMQEADFVIAEVQRTDSQWCAHYKKTRDGSAQHSTGSLFNSKRVEAWL